MTPRVLLEGLAMPESPGWHDGRLWFSNQGRGRSSPSTSTARAKSSTKAPTGSAGNQPAPRRTPAHHRPRVDPGSSRTGRAFGTPISATSHRSGGARSPDERGNIYVNRGLPRTPDRRLQSAVELARGVKSAHLGSNQAAIGHFFVPRTARGTARSRTSCSIASSSGAEFWDLPCTYCVISRRSPKRAGLSLASSCRFCGPHDCGALKPPALFARSPS